MRDARARRRVHIVLRHILHRAHAAKHALAVVCARAPQAPSSEPETRSELVPGARIRHCARRRVHIVLRHVLHRAHAAKHALAVVCARAPQAPSSEPETRSELVPGARIRHCARRRVHIVLRHVLHRAHAAKHALAVVCARAPQAPSSEPETRNELVPGARIRHCARRCVHIALRHVLHRAHAAKHALAVVCARAAPASSAPNYLVVLLC